MHERLDERESDGSEIDNKCAIISFTRSLFSDTSASAGSEYVRRHYAVLQELGYKIVAVSEVTPGNLRAVANPQPRGIEIILVPRARFANTYLGRVLQRLLYEVHLISERVGYSYAVSRSAIVSEKAASAKFAEIQWVESFSLWRQVRKMAPELPLLGIVHDVVSQRTSRELGFGGRVKLSLAEWRSHPLKAARLKLVVMRERELTKNFTSIITFSDKDTQLLRDIGVTAPISLVLPGLENPRMAETTLRKRYPARLSDRSTVATILFVGAFQRPANQDAALWLLSEIWPRVLSSVGTRTCRLVLAGAAPTELMKKTAAGIANVEITGYVSNLDELYASADLAISPLRFGAGVKFKSVTAMMWGLPLVSTSVGAEGIETFHKIECIADDSEGFAAGIVRAVLNMDEAVERARELQSWARSAYGSEAFEASIRDALRALLNDKVNKEPKHWERGIISVRSRNKPERQRRDE